MNNYREQITEEIGLVETFGHDWEQRRRVEAVTISSAAGATCCHPPSGLLCRGPLLPLPLRTCEPQQQLQIPHSFHGRGPHNVTGMDPSILLRRVH